MFLVLLFWGPIPGLPGEPHVGRGLCTETRRVWLAADGANMEVSTPPQEAPVLVELPAWFLLQSWRVEPWWQHTHCILRCPWPPRLLEFWAYLCGVKLTQAVTAPGDRFSMAHKGLVVQGRVLLGLVKAVSSQCLASVEAVIGHPG